MSIGPLRRTIGALGLVVLIPLAWMVAAETVTPVDAAMRAALILLGVTTLGRLASLGVSRLAATIEQGAGADHDRQAAESEHPSEAGVARRSAPSDPDRASGATDGAPQA